MSDFRVPLFATVRAESISAVDDDALADALIAMPEVVAVESYGPERDLTPYHAEAVDDAERTLRGVRRLLGWDEEEGSTAATLADMGHEVEPDATEDDIREAAQTALAEWPLVDAKRITTYTILFGCGGPTVYAELDVETTDSGPVLLGGRYVTTAPGYAESVGAQTVDLTAEQAEPLYQAFIPEAW